MAASAGNAIGMYGSIQKNIEAKKMQRKGQEGIDSFKWMDLENAYSDTTISTAGGELQMENAATNTASMVDAARSAGSRGLVGSLESIQANNNQIAGQVAANWDAQQKGIDFAKAGDKGVLRGMNEVRQSNELAGYGQMMGVGMDMKYQSYADMQATGNAQSQHNMELFKTFGSSMGGGGMGGGK